MIAFGVIFLGDPCSLLSAAGMAMAMGGGLWYGKARARALEFTPRLPPKPEKEPKKLSLEASVAEAIGPSRKPLLRPPNLPADGDDVERGRLLPEEEGVEMRGRGD